MNDSIWAPKPSPAGDPQNQPPTPPADMQQQHQEALPPVESFAQTGPDTALELFDDAPSIADDEAMRIRSEDDLFSDDFTPASEPVVEQAAAAPVLPAATSRTATGTNHATRGGGDGGRGGRGRGRGRGRGGLGRRGEEDVASRSTATPPAAEARGENASATSTPPRPESTPTNTTTLTQTPPVKPTPSVRGDRHATGGLPRPKLTESELAEKMEAIRIKNAALHAAHARAEADAASFAEREKRALRRTAEERAQRRKLEVERERNRERKLRAKGGREWDVGKEEAGWGQGGGGRERRDEADDGREYIYHESKRGFGPEKGRGERVRGGAGEQHVRVPRQEDFPALPPPPSSMKKKTATAGDTAEAKGSWADQMESTTNS